MKKIFIYIICALSLNACGELPSRLDSLIEQQPRVILVNPSDGQVVQPNIKITAVFSDSLDPTTVNQSTFIVGKINGGSDDIVEDLSANSAVTLNGLYNLSDNWKQVTLEPEDLLEEGVYGIVITSDIKNLSSLPLNQTPGSSPSPYFSSFIVTGKTVDDTGDVLNNETETNPNDNTNVPAENNSTIRPDNLVINELLYDASSSESDGNLFIELFGDSDSDITDYEVLFINGADGKVTARIKLPKNSIMPEDGIFVIADSKTSSSTTTNIIESDLIDNFDPQNGPDCVQLLDNSGELLDSLGYGDGLPEVAENGLECFEGQPALDVPAGVSLTRTQGIDTDNNSVDFISQDTPTPGLI